MEPNSPAPPQVPEQPQQPQQPIVAPVNPTPQPMVSPAPVIPVAPLNNPQPADPGKTLGTLSIVLCLLGWVGIIIGAIGFTKSKKAGYKNTRAIIGIILSSIIFIAVGIGLVAYIRSDSFKQIYCQDYPSDNMCVARRASTDTTKSTNQTTITTGDSAYYGALTKTTSFTSATYSDLITATPKFLKTLQTDKNSGSARQNITIGSHAITILTYDTNGKYDSKGRFSEFLIPGINDPCYTDFQNDVSVRILYDPPNADGNLSMVEIFDKTNCTSSDQLVHGTNGDIELESGTISVPNDVPQATKTVADGVASQMRVAGW